MVFWLHRKDDIGIKDIFEAYFKLRLEQYVNTHKYDDDAWNRNLEKEFICYHHIPSEKNLIKASEALFAYITESDAKKVMSISSNYLKFARARRKELYPTNHPANSQREFLQLKNDEGKTLEEIAEITGKPKTSIKTTISSARRLSINIHIIH